MSEIQELKDQLDRVDVTLGLLVDVARESIPQLKNDINDIVKNIKGGFDKEELAGQIRAVLNQVINQSDYTKLQANIDSTAKKMIDAVETSSRQVDQWRDDYQKRSRWHFALISGAICFILGSGIMWKLENSRIEKYQYAIDQTNGMAGYINSSCNTKQGYAKFLGVATDKKPYDCNKYWLTSSEILNTVKKD